MTITIVTMYNDRRAMHYVGAVAGPLDEEHKQELADRFCCVRSSEEMPEDGCQMFFREIKVEAGLPGELLNIDGEEYPEG